MTNEEIEQIGADAINKKIHESTDFSSLLQEFCLKDITCSRHNGGDAMCCLSDGIYVSAVVEQDRPWSCYQTSRSDKRQEYLRELHKKLWQVIDIPLERTWPLYSCTDDTCADGNGDYMIMFRVELAAQVYIDPKMNAKPLLDRETYVDKVNNVTKGSDEKGKGNVFTDYLDVVKKGDRA